MAIQTVEVRWQGRMLESGTFPRGEIVATPAGGRLQDPTAGEFILGIVRAEIDPDTGSAVLNLPATDDPAVEPQGFTYTIQERLTNANGAAYSIQPTVADVAAGIDLATLTTMFPTSLGTSPVALDALAVEQAKLDAEAAAAQAVAVATGDLDPANKVLIEDPNSQTAAALSTTFATPMANSAVILGHSIVQVATMFPGIYNAAWNKDTANVYDSGYSFFTWANVRLGGRLRLLRNSGISGQRTDEVLARMDADVYGLAEKPRFVVVLAMRNDLDQDVPLGTITANLQAIYDRVLAEGSYLVACTEMPSLNDATDAEKAKYHEANRWVREYAAHHRGVILCDWARAWADPATGEPQSVFRLSGDNTHPSPVGAMAMGRVLAAALEPFVGGTRDLVGSNADPSSLGRNPCMVGTTGSLAAGATGQVADGWAVNWSGAAGVLTASKVARGDGIPGEWQQLSISTAAGSYTRFDYTGYSTSKGTLWNPGDSLYAEVEYEIDGDPSTFTRLQVQTYLAGHGINAYAVQDTFAGTKSLPTSGVIRTPVLKSPTTTTAIGVGIQLGGTGTIRLGRFAVRKAFGDRLPLA